MAVNLVEYRKTLKTFIEDPANEMVLNAQQVQEPDGTVREVSNAWFELTSGLYQQQFLTIWPLFRNPDEFNRCLDHLVAMADKVRTETNFTALASCTNTARYLVNELHARLEGGKTRLRTYHLGPYPYYGVDPDWRTDMKGEEVLIVTDVVASGRLAKNMAASIAEFGGKCVGVVAIAVVNPEFADYHDEHKSYPALPYSNPQSVALYALTDYRIIRDPNADPAKAKLIRAIDPVTVTPENYSHRPDPAQLAENLRHLIGITERHDAISFGYFQSQDHLFCVGLKFEKFLEQYGGGIWDRFAAHLEDDENLVYITSHNPRDIALLSFLGKKHLEVFGRQPEYVHLARESLADGSSTFSMTKPLLPTIKDKRVVLVLASLYAQEKLGNLAVQLVAANAASVLVFGLLNRMDPHSTDFMVRITHLRSAFAPNGVPIKIDAAFHLADVRQSNLARMNQTLRQIFDRYRNSTKVKRFAHRVDQELTYFEFKPITSWDFKEFTTKPLPEPQTLSIGPRKRRSKSKKGSSTVEKGSATIEVKTEAAKLAVICHQFSAFRDYSLVIEALSEFSDKSTLYKLFGILLSDMTYIKVTREFEAAHDALISRIRDLRQKRINMEDTYWASLGSQNPSPCPSELIADIKKKIDIEVHLLFGLALLAFLDLDHERDYLAIANEVLTGKDNPEQYFKKNPWNFVSVFEDDRTIWSISLLLHTRFDGVNLANVGSDFRARLEREVRMVQDLLAKAPLQRRSMSWSPDGGLILTEDVRDKIRSNFDAVLSDLGIHKMQALHEVIRYIHREILKDPERHSVVATNFQRLVAELDRFLDQAQPNDEEGSDVSRRHMFDAVPELAQSVRRALDDGLYSAGQFEELAAVAARFFDLAPAHRRGAGRYLATNGKSAFAEDASRLSNLVSFSRQERAISTKQCEDVRRLVATLWKDAWDQISPLSLALRTYIVPVRPMLVEALELARDDLRRRFGIDGVWDRMIDRYSRQLESGRDGVPPASDQDSADASPLVLCDPRLLREVLKNLFVNARHGLEGMPRQNRRARGDHKYHAKVDLRVWTEAAGPDRPLSEPREYIVVAVSTGPKPMPQGYLERHDERRTIHEHRDRLIEYGATLSAEPSSPIPKF